MKNAGYAKRFWDNNGFIWNINTLDILSGIILQACKLYD